MVHIVKIIEYLRISMLGLDHLILLFKIIKYSQIDIQPLEPYSQNN